MKTLISIFCLFLLACGTTTKVHSSGKIEFNKMEKGEILAPVLLQYKFLIPSDQHELFFWDQDKNRFNLKVSGKTDTASGILIYLPADRAYALSGFLTVKTVARTEYSLGTELNLFRVKPGMINVLPYFEISPAGDQFDFDQSSTSKWESATKKFSPLKPVNEIKVDLLGRED